MILYVRVIFLPWFFIVWPPAPNTRAGRGGGGGGGGGQVEDFKFGFIGGLLNRLTFRVLSGSGISWIALDFFLYWKMYSKKSTFSGLFWNCSWIKNFDNQQVASGCTLFRSPRLFQFCPRQPLTGLVIR